MNQLKKSNATLTWTDDCEKAWTTVKERLASAPIMGYPDYSRPLFLHTDACKSGFAAFLTQEQDGKPTIVDASSRTTNSSEKNYSSAKLECACVIWIAKKWKHHLLSAPHTTIVTDSYGLQYLQQKGSRSALVERWLCEMEGFSYSVMYRRGSMNIADFLSRQNDIVAVTKLRSKDKDERVDYQALSKGVKRTKRSGQQTSSVDRPRKKTARAPSKYISIATDVACLIEEQEKDEYIQRIWKIAQREENGGGNIRGKSSSQDIQDAQHIRKIEGVIVKDIQDTTGIVRSRVIVPGSMQLGIVEQVHQSNHAGVLGTFRLLARDHWFRGMKEMVKRVVRACPDCIAVKGRPITTEVMAPDTRPLSLGDRWHIDGLALPMSKGYDHLIVATDAATKYVILRKSLGETSQAAVDILMTIASRVGHPKQVTTDRGRAFMSIPFETICHDFGIEFKPAAVGQPQANGMVERVNRTILQAATILGKGRQEVWADHVEELEYALNTRISSVTGFSPYELVFGRQPPGPTYLLPIRKEEEEKEGMTWDERVAALRERIKLFENLAHENQMEAAEKQMTYHEAHAQAHHFNVNDYVWYYRKSSLQKGITSKLKYSWTGPFRIVKAIGPVNYVLQDKEGKILPGTYHARLLYKPQAKPEAEERRDRKGGRCSDPSP